jgi:hypothetical protein
LQNFLIPPSLGSKGENNMFSRVSEIKQIILARHGDAAGNPQIL